MTYLWVAVGLFAASVLYARWQFSRARVFANFLWYRHWRMRERSRAFESRMFFRYPRFMRWTYRVRQPYYRIVNHDRVWPLRFWLGGVWYRYAAWWAPKCKEHGTALSGGYCFNCGMLQAVRQQKAKMISGHGDPNLAKGIEMMEKLFDKKR